MTNPYAPPSADLGAPESPRRPLPVWIISLLYGAASPLLAVILLALYLLTGSLDAAPPELQRLVRQGPNQVIFTIAYDVLLTGFGVTFFLLRRIAIPILAAAISLLLAEWMYRGIASSVFPGLQQAASLALMLAILWYARRLRIRGVLR